MDIISLPVDYDKKKIENRYRLVVIASQRARELSLGVKQRVQTKAKKMTTTALLETITGEIEFLTGDEAVVAREKAERIDFKKLAEEKRRPAEDLSELEKDLRVYLHEKGATERALEELFTETERLEDTEE
ncbi:MAG: DNA-directed RNA polymerase subunit omega [Thermodesulfovibrionales bacterium]|nr:DNA-directed RNA polymerase subunit omega [Thermodesulfovibrionales bacterium]